MFRMSMVMSSASQTCLLVTVKRLLALRTYNGIFKTVNLPWRQPLPGSSMGNNRCSITHSSLPQLAPACCLCLMRGPAEMRMRFGDGCIQDGAVISMSRSTTDDHHFPQELFCADNQNSQRLPDCPRRLRWRQWNGS